MLSKNTIVVAKELDILLIAYGIKRWIFTAYGNYLQGRHIYIYVCVCVYVFVFIDIVSNIISRYMLQQIWKHELFEDINWNYTFDINQY